MNNIYAGFDIGGSTVRLALFDSDLNLLKNKREYLPKFAEPALVASTMRQLFDDLDSPAPSAIGIGLAAQLDPSASSVANAPNLGWIDVPFRDIVSYEFPNTPIFLYNDLAAILAGEWFRGAANGYDDVLAVFVGTGIGSAFISGGHLIYGATNNAGELGHFKVEIGGRRCGCGQLGCTEAYVSGYHLAAQLRERYDDVCRQLSLDISDLTDPELLARADTAFMDGPCGDIWRKCSDYLALTIASATTLLNPALLLLGGGILENLNNYRELTVSKIFPLIVEVASKNLTIEFSKLGGNKAGVLGAAFLARKDSMKS